MTPAKLAPSPFEQLPDELIGQILAFLDTTSIISLHRVSSRLRSVSRFDGLIWRSYCLSNHPDPRSLAPSSDSQFPVTAEANSLFLRSSQPGKFTFVANTDLGSRIRQVYLRQGEEEAIDWYREYQYRNAKLPDNSFIKFRAPDGLDIVDAALADNNDDYDKKLVAACALQDGSICIFSLRDGEIGTVLGRSKSGVLARRNINSFSTGAHNLNGDENKMANRDRGLNVDAAIASGARAWFGTGSILTEFDLNTMQKVRTHRFPFSVTCLSTVLPIMAVGTTLTLHLLDARSPCDSIASTSVSSSGSVSNGEKIDQYAPTYSTARLTNKKTAPNSSVQAHKMDHDEDSSRDHLLHAPPTVFLQPSPLSIVHSPLDQACGNELYVAGRFPSIMAYDRRYWPRIAGTMHSGGRLSGLTIMAANPWHPLPSKYSLVACGEYGGRGTLEIYPLPSVPDSNAEKVDSCWTDGTEVGREVEQRARHLYSKSTSMALKNRQSASRCKIFSVATQGIKIITGDSEGRIRFVERNGITHIRDWACPTGGGVRKILPLLPSATDLRPSIENADLLLQLDEDIGVLTFGSKGAGGDYSDRDITSLRHLEEINAEERYTQVMRNALEHHNQELMFLKGLGQ